MKRLQKFLLLALFASFLIGLAGQSPLAKAGTPPWQSNLAGLDGVTLACASANREKYATRICNTVMGALEETFQQASIPVAVLGSYYVKSENPPAKPAAFNKPLEIVIFVRGANSSRIYGINVRLRISVAYAAAVEAGESNANGRKGQLVLFETETTGAGPRKGLTRAIAASIIKKSAREISAIVDSWPKN